jgi:gluconolactonase
VFDKTKSPVAEGAVPVKIADGFIFTEGSVSDKDGNVYFVDQDNNRIMKWTFLDEKDPTKGKLETFLKPSNYSNGMCFDNDWNLISCADEKNELWSIEMPNKPIPDGGFKQADLKITVLIKNLNDKLLNGPNDVWVVPKGPLAGAMFFTDPLYARKWWAGFRDNTMQQPGKYAYFMSADHKTIKPVVTDYRTPNGIIGTPDGKTLYVADIDARQTNSYTIKDDGTLADKKLFAMAGSDGMTIDSDGNIYMTNGGTGVSIWDKDGKQIDNLTPGSGCANVCFGGKNKDILFVCSKTEVWGVRMKTHGVGSQ